MNVVNINGIVSKVPDKWNELNLKQVKWLMRYPEHILKPSLKFRMKTFLYFIGNRWWTFRLHRYLHRANLGDLVWTSKVIDWIFSIDKIDLTRNVWRKYKGFVGPADGLQNLSLEEFSFADFHFRQFLTTQDMGELNKLVAILWREKQTISVDSIDFKNDERIPFNSYAITKKSSSFCKADLRFKWFVFFFFYGCRNQIVKTFPETFNGGKDNAQGLDIGWIKVMFDLAGNKFGTLKETSKEDLTTILLYLEDSIIQNKNNRRNERRES